MSAKKRGGGRTTPKGTQPAGTHATKSGDRTAPVRSFGSIDPAKTRAAQGPIGPTRSGHHRGNR
jgi:hypothetical protein